jgi:hypothetical protein
MKNNIDNLVFPVILLDLERNIIDIIKRSEHLKISTKLGLKENILVDALVFDSNNKAFKIKTVKDLGLKHSFWKFEFFNPMHIIDLLFEEIKYNVQEFKIKIIDIINKEDSAWSEYPFKKSLIKEIDKSKSQTEIIKCFMQIEN